MTSTYYAIGTFQPDGWSMLSIPDYFFRLGEIGRLRQTTVCVCLSVKSHLTSGASVRPENAVTYSAGNEGQKIVAFSLKPMCFEDRTLPPFDGHT